MIGKSQEQLHILRNHLSEAELRSLIFSSSYYLNEQHQQFSAFFRAFSIPIFQKFGWGANLTNARNHFLNNTLLLIHAVTVMVLVLGAINVEFSSSCLKDCAETDWKC